MRWRWAISPPPVMRPAVSWPPWLRECTAPSGNARQDPVPELPGCVWGPASAPRSSATSLIRRCAPVPARSWLTSTLTSSRAPGTTCWNADPSVFSPSRFEWLGYVRSTTSSRLSPSAVWSSSTTCPPQPRIPPARHQWHRRHHQAGVAHPPEGPCHRDSARLRHGGHRRLPPVPARLSNRSSYLLHTARGPVVVHGPSAVVSNLELSEQRCPRCSPRRWRPARSTSCEAPCQWPRSGAWPPPHAAS